MIAQTPDARHTGLSSARGPSAWKKRWVVEQSLDSYDPPGFAAAANGAAFAITRNDREDGFVLRSWDAQGKPRWACGVPEQAQSAPTTTADGGVVAALFDGTLVEVGADGRLRWSFSAGAPLSSSPTVGPDGATYVGAQDDCAYALTAEGKLKWKFETQGFVMASPAVAPDGTVLVASSDRNLYAVDPSGKEKWRFATKRPLSASPVVAGDGTICQGSEDGTLYALDAAGKERWRVATEGWICFAPCLDAKGDVLVASNDGLLRSLTPDGRARWKAVVGMPESNLVCDAEGEVYVSTSSGLQAIDAEGKRVWAREDCRAGCLALTADGTLYAQTTSLLYALHE